MGGNVHVTICTEINLVYPLTRRSQNTGHSVKKYQITCNLFDLGLPLNIK